MNTRFTSALSRSASLAASLALLASPITSHADSDAAMDACVQAFVSANVPKDHPIKVRKVILADGPLAVQDRAYRITLTAKGATSGKQFARGTCIVGRDGEIIALNGRSATPQLAAR
jgi:hypothetical protein